MVEEGEQELVCVQLAAGETFSLSILFALFTPNSDLWLLWGEKDDESLCSTPQSLRNLLVTLAVYSVSLSEANCSLIT